MSIEKTLFRQVMGQFTTGITVVTTRSHEVMVGLTVNSFCSVSLDPPLVLICVDLNSSTLSYFRESGSFAVNILSDQQEHLARCFATSSRERYKHFCCANYHIAATGSPIIDGVVAFIDARIIEVYPGGDHVIIVGQVEAMAGDSQVAFKDDAGEHCTNLTEYFGKTPTDGKAEPLAYYQGQYRHLAPDYQRPSLTTYSDEQDYLIVR